MMKCIKKKNGNPWKLPYLKQNVVSVYFSSPDKFDSALDMALGGAERLNIPCVTVAFDEPEKDTKVGALIRYTPEAIRRLVHIRKEYVLGMKYLAKYGCWSAIGTLVIVLYGLNIRKIPNDLMWMFYGAAHLKVSLHVITTPHGLPPNLMHNASSVFINGTEPNLGRWKDDCALVCDRAGKWTHYCWC